MENQSAQATEQVNTQPSQTPQPETNSFNIPETYKDRGWTAKIKSNDDVWKLLDNSQSLLGKRPAGIPTNDAPQEEWDKFFQSTRPADKNYNLGDIEGLPEGLDLAPFKQKASDFMYEAGLTQKQADMLWKKYIASELEAVKQGTEQSKAKQAELDAEFDKYRQEIFGDKYDMASKNAQDMINKYVPEQLRGSYADIAENPKLLSSVIAALNGAFEEIQSVKKQYGAEGGITTGTQPTNESIDDIRKNLAVLRASQASKDFLHPDHKKTLEEIDKLSGKVQSYYNKK